MEVNTNNPDDLQGSGATSQVSNTSKPPSPVSGEFLHLGTAKFANERKKLQESATSRTVDYFRGLAPASTFPNALDSFPWHLITTQDGLPTVTIGSKTKRIA